MLTKCTQETNVIVMDTSQYRLGIGDPCAVHRHMGSGFGCPDRDP